VLDFDEDDMLITPYRVVPDRGRAGQFESNVCESFTAEQLDALAPLEPDDAREMGAYTTPRSETISRVQKRIQAARRLKYGG